MGRFSVRKLPGISVVRDSSEENRKAKFTFWNNIEEGHVCSLQYHSNSSQYIIEDNCSGSGPKLNNIYQKCH